MVGIVVESRIPREFINANPEDHMIQVLTSRGQIGWVYSEWAENIT